MNLTDQPAEIFIRQITYLPFRDVISACQTNARSLHYCTHSKYSKLWKKLIDNTFRDTFGYSEHLKRIWDDLDVPEGTYNYLVYVTLVKLLDPVTQLRIYYKQGDMKSFESEIFNDVQRFLALALMRDPLAREYLKNIYNPLYAPTLDLMDDRKTVYDLNRLLEIFSKEGSPLGVSMILDMGANIEKAGYPLMLASEYGNLGVVKHLVNRGADVHYDADAPLLIATQRGHLDIIKYLVSKGADIHAQDDLVLLWPSTNGRLDILKYFIEQGVDVDARFGLALSTAATKGYFNMVKYLISKGADVNIQNSQPLKLASYNGHLNIVQYLVEHGAEVNPGRNPFEGFSGSPLRWASKAGKLDVVKYLLENGADIHADGDYALREASKGGHLDVVKYLVEKGADVHADGDYALLIAKENGHSDVAKFLENL